MDTLVLGDLGFSVTSRTIEKEGRICQGGGGGKTVGSARRAKNRPESHVQKGRELRFLTGDPWAGNIRARDLDRTGWGRGRYWGRIRSQKIRPHFAEKRAKC